MSKNKANNETQQLKLAKNWNQALISYIDYRNGIRKLIRISDQKVTRYSVQLYITSYILNQVKVMLHILLVR